MAALRAEIKADSNKERTATAGHHIEASVHTWKTLVEIFLRANGSGNITVTRENKRGQKKILRVVNLEAEDFRCYNCERRMQGEFKSVATCERCKRELKAKQVIDKVTESQSL